MSKSTVNAAPDGESLKTLDVNSEHDRPVKPGLASDGQNFGSFIWGD